MGGVDPLPTMILQAELPIYLFILHQTEHTNVWEQVLERSGIEIPSHRRNVRIGDRNPLPQKSIMLRLTLIG